MSEETMLFEDVKIAISKLPSTLLRYFGYSLISIAIASIGVLYYSQEYRSVNRNLAGLHSAIFIFIMMLFSLSLILIFEFARPFDHRVWNCIYGVWIGVVGLITSPWVIPQVFSDSHNIQIPIYIWLLIGITALAPINFTELFNDIRALPANLRQFVAAIRDRQNAAK